MPGPPGPPPVSPDILAQLLGASFRGVSFPSLMFSTKGSHNVVIHKRVDRDGWRVENTGQNGNVHSFKIPCVNTIVPGLNETWIAGQLYPANHNRLIVALTDRTSGPFVHPHFGKRTCKVAEWESTLDPDFRGGPTLMVTLFETVDDTGDAVALATTSISSLATAAALSLDATFAPLVPPPDTGTPGGISLSDFLKSLGALADEWSLMKMQWAASIDRVSYQLGVLEEKFGDSPGFSDQTERLISALHAIKANALATGAATSVYIVPQRATAAQVANRLGNTLSQIYQLNPQLARSPIVQPTTPVVYYT